MRFFLNYVSLNILFNAAIACSMLHWLRFAPGGNKKFK